MTNPRPRGGRWVGPALALISLLLAGAGASWVYERWRTSEARSLQDAQEDHIVDFAALLTGAKLELLAFPATDRFDEVPRFTAQLNEWKVRDRSFTEQPAPGVRRIMAVGESSTFGTGLNVGERFTELLGADLERRHPGCCEVLNAGRMGQTTPTAVRFIKTDVARWGVAVLIYDSMANDLNDPSRPGVRLNSPADIAVYEGRLRDLTDFCAARDIAVVFWANTIAEVGDDLAPYREAMQRVADASGSGFVDLGQLYRDQPATPDEVAAFLAEPNWTRWFDVVHPPEVPIERVALHVDWVHPNRFGSRRLADGLRPLVERALGLESP